MSHSWMTLSQVKQFLPQAKIVNAPSTEVVINRFISDSRQVEQGDCFIAIRGEKFDAHDFLAEVQGKGASIALVSSVERLPNGLCGILVKDTILALQELAREWQKEFKFDQIYYHGWHINNFSLGWQKSRKPTWAREKDLAFLQIVGRTFALLCQKAAKVSGNSNRIVW